VILEAWHHFISSHHPCHDVPDAMPTASSCHGNWLYQLAAAGESAVTSASAFVNRQAAVVDSLQAPTSIDSLAPLRFVARRAVGSFTYHESLGFFLAIRRRGSAIAAALNAVDS